MATGHYARVIETENGPRLGRALDRTKDQAYVLWGITMEQLRSTLLPLGDYTKEQIRAIAVENGLASANRPDSQDLCFIPKGTTTQTYLSNFLVEAPGAIIHTITGDVLGEHKGTHNYTIGQRKGLGIAYPEPLYVTSLDPELRVVFAGPKEALYRTELTASDMNWLMDEIPDGPFDALVKIRYNSDAVPGRVIPMGNRQVKVTFTDPQPAITPGQVLGIFDLEDTYIFGGGWID